MKLGARIFKTGLSVVLAIYVALIFKLDTTMLVAIAAALSVFPSVYRSWKHMLNQFQANLIGALLAIIAFMTLGGSPLAIGFVVICVISINLKLNFHDTIGVTVVTVIAIMQAPEGNFLIFAFERFASIMIGISSSLLINLIFMPPKYETRLFQQLKKSSDHILILLRIVTDEEAFNETTYKSERTKVKNEVKQSVNMYNFYEDEFHKLFKKQGYSKIKKLVIFKEMIAILNKELELLKLVKKKLMPNPNISIDIKNEVKMCLLYLTSYNERIFFKFENSIHLNKTTNETPIDLVEINDSLTSRFIELYEKDEIKNCHTFLPVFSSLIEITSELEKLDRHIDNYLIHQNKPKKKKRI